MPMTLHQLNAAGGDEAARLLDGVYEHSPWITEAALAHRPFRSLAHLRCVMARVVDDAGHEARLALVRAHPELAGKALVAQALTPESTGEQRQAGLANCTPEEYGRLQELNAQYNARFGFPFILAVRGPRGTGVPRRDIIATFERRLDNHPDVELAEALRNVHRIAELRLNDRFGLEPALGNLVWDQLEELAQHSDPGWRERGQLTVTYLTEAHGQVAARIAQHMRDSGFDEVGTDAVGNVVGVYHGSGSGQRRRLLTGSHYDTVRNGGKYDGRLGIFTPMACVGELSRQGRRLPFDIELVAFAEEEGQRYHVPFLASGALIGSFDPSWLDQQDADGVTMREAMRQAGLPGTLEAIGALRRDPARYLGFVEVHIEQGPVLTERDLPLGVVTSINGGARLRCEIVGMASHAGTTPMDRRRDAAAAFAELALYVERRAGQDGDSVGTIGILEVPGGSINVVPGRCAFTLDLRAPSDAQRDALVRDVLSEFAAICERRGVRHTLEQTMQVAAAPSAPAWQLLWERAVAELGVPVFRMPSGAGHDAMKLHQVMPQAMLFVRGQNLGISHNPLEAMTSDDIQLGIDAYLRLLEQLAAKAPA